MTTPSEDTGALAEVERAVEMLKAAILAFFETNPLPDELQQLDKDRLRTEVVTRVHQRPTVAAQAPDARAALHAPPHKPGPAAAGSPAKPPHTKAAKPHVDHGKERKDAQAKHPDLESLAESWDKKFPQDKKGVAGLDGTFGKNADAFIKAMEAAGITVTVAGATRLPERAYLMRCAYLIYHGEYAVVVSELAHKPGTVDIDWEEIKKAAVDEQGFKEFARLLAGKLGIGLGFSQAPSLTSNHIKGLAVDLDIDGWQGKNVADADGKKTPIATFEDLEKVGATYKVLHFLKPGEPNHWSINAH